MDKSAKVSISYVKLGIPSLDDLPSFERNPFGDAIDLSIIPAFFAFSGLKLVGFSENHKLWTKERPCWSQWSHSLFPILRHLLNDDGSLFTIC